VLDSGAHFYDVYPCADDELISIGPIEGRFHADLLRHLQIDPNQIGEQNDPRNWPAARALFTQAFARHPRAYWCDLLEGTDVCFAPVLSFAQAPEHPHLKARGTFVEIDGVVQPAPAPRFSRTPSALPTPPQKASIAGIDDALGDWLPAARIAEWCHKEVMGDGAT
jgi:crotonobetainyl-CoA:carnitine CoA-transferase CaiB-like acyl-CoA transferase